MKRTWMLLSAGVLSAALWAGDWPQFRGPQRNGISQETGLLPEWPKPNTLHLTILMAAEMSMNGERL
jgi:hypothetical protein